MSQAEDDSVQDAIVSRNRLIGSVVWLLLLVVVVPIWYNDPVDFHPSNTLNASQPATPVVSHAFVLPQDAVVPKTPVQTTSPKSKEEPAKLVEADLAKQSAEKSAKPKADDKKSDAQATESTQAKEQQGVIKTQAKKQQSIWILRLVAYKNKEMAEEMRSRLSYDYEAFIKYFPKTDYYSVRIGPYLDEAQAKKDQNELNRLLRVKSELVKITPSSL
ncbi:SPOR domain-containing protein [Thiosulfativibrio zosterae]|uniref:SPOR domain-containing protein n=1 Tax=Thiosulfativibrio zosterae TaxID=2675053 RepID=A0A6F8PPA3_9GAMM|nr:SPOR domain-containing protein [Thiosulfativibrio zosterae]BBP43952.1 hypothetical protein THMIRHAT_16980 [Thiosulfativibrio zosterae]